MNFMKSVGLMAMGAGAYMAYEKYKAPMSKKVCEVATNVKKTATKKLEDMMD